MKPIGSDATKLKDALDLIPNDKKTLIALKELITLMCSTDPDSRPKAWDVLNKMHSIADTNKIHLFCCNTDKYLEYYNKATIEECDKSIFDIKSHSDDDSFCLPMN